MSLIPKNGLVMTGGGARGAYQAGVLRRIAEIPAFREGRSPFPIVTGASAGALNAAAVAVGTEDFAALTRKLYEVWATVQAQDVFRVDALTMARIARVWAKDLALGGFMGGGVAES
jgi:NTE family protein